VSESFSPVPLVPDRRLRRTGEARRPATRRNPDADPVDGWCVICGDRAERWFSGNRACDPCYRALGRLHNHGVRHAFLVLRELLGFPKPERPARAPKPTIAKPRKAPRAAPPTRKAAPIAESVPVAAPPPKPASRTIPEGMSLRDRLKARREAAGGNEGR
jgi:hypothetical protein